MKKPANCGTCCQKNLALKAPQSVPSVKYKSGIAYKRIALPTTAPMYPILKKANTPPEAFKVERIEPVLVNAP